MYIAALENKSKSNMELLGLVQPNLPVLSDAWFRAIKDHGILKLPPSLLEDIASEGMFNTSRKKKHLVFKSYLSQPWYYLFQEVFYIFRIRNICKTFHLSPCVAFFLLRRMYSHGKIYPIMILLYYFHQRWFTRSWRLPENIFEYKPRPLIYLKFAFIVQIVILETGLGMGNWYCFYPSAKRGVIIN